MNWMTARAASVLGCALALAWCGADRVFRVHGAEEAGAAATSAAEDVRHFDANIAPLLVRRCLECHGSTSKKGGLDLSQKAAALAGGKSGKAVVPGKAADSLLWEQVELDAMPKGRPPLSAEEKAHLRKWIDAGAVWSADAIDPSKYRKDPAADGNWVRRLTVPEYVETVRSTVGVDVSRDAPKLLPRDVRADGFSNTSYNLGVDLAHIEAYSRLAEIIVGRMDMSEFAAPYANRRELTDANMREVISVMGKRLLRGPLEEHEIAAFLKVSTGVAEEGGDFDEAVSYVVEAMLQAPRFIYRIEAQRGDGTAQRVGGYELASRLSYILWGGPPDDELMRAADAGELADRSRVEAQVGRMLEDPRSVERSARFVHEWLNLDRLESLNPNRDRFPKWNGQLAADMRDETLSFFKSVAWEQKRPLSDLMNAQVTFATPALAAHYALDSKHAEAARREERAAPARESLKSRRVGEGLQALYTFEEAGGDTVRDVSGAGEPIHLKIADASAVRWSDEGLAVNSSTLIAGERPPARLIEAFKKSNSVTIEAWITPASRSQTGPARIVTLSSNIGARNFTLGQEGDKYDVRFRTTQRDGNGLPSLSGPAGSAATRPTHVVYTRGAAGKTRLYLDGEKQAEADVGGDLSNWDGGLRLALTNELTRDRPWQGTLHLVALYDRQLSADEVRRNRAAGARQNGPPALAGRGDFDVLSKAFRARRAGDELQALYTFEEGGGDTVRDVSGAGAPLDLKIENVSAVRWEEDRLSVNAQTLIATAEPPKRLIDALKKSNAVTIEAWITPGETKQSGPARIVTLSLGPNQRNFTLGQDEDKYDVRFRTTKTDANGHPSLASPGGTVATRPTHVVYTRDPAGKSKLYVNGEEKSAHEVGGDLSNWGENFRLALANETTNDRLWRGTFHLVAIYSRALTAEEVRSTGAGLSRFDLTSVPGRGGLLTQGSVLTIGGDEASMVTRGLFVLSDLLYSGVEDPPPCVDTTPVPTKPGQSQRAVAELRLADQSCSGCHSKFEPLAFGLEKFDGVGAYHEQDEHGNTLREDGEVHFPDQEKPVSYRTSAELMDLLAGSERISMGITRKVTQFALGRPLVEADEPVLEMIHQKSQKEGGTYASLMTAIVLSDLVQTTPTVGE